MYHFVPQQTPRRAAVRAQVGVGEVPSGWSATWTLLGWTVFGLAVYGLVTLARK